MLSGRKMGPLGADFNIDLTNDNALQLPSAHAGSLALPERPSSIKDQVLSLPFDAQHLLIRTASQPAM